VFLSSILCSIISAIAAYARLFKSQTNPIGYRFSHQGISVLDIAKGHEISINRLAFPHAFHSTQNSIMTQPAPAAYHQPARR